MRIEQTQVVKAPREQVFQAWTDYDVAEVFGPLHVRHGRGTCRKHRTCRRGNQSGAVRRPGAVQVKGQI
jgi:hypothetical protein